MYGVYFIGKIPYGEVEPVAVVSLEFEDCWDDVNPCEDASWSPVEDCPDECE